MALLIDMKRAKTEAKLILMADFFRMDQKYVRLHLSFSLVSNASSSVTSENSIVSRIFSLSNKW